MTIIYASVGKGGRNQKKDVLAIQKALNQIPPNQGGASPKLKEDGLIGPKTNGAILAFQKAHSGLTRDGRIDVNRATWKRIIDLLPPKFTQKNLYGPAGPSPNDIYQDSFGDCYFVATLAAVAKANPAAIRAIIQYNANLRQFRVRLFDKKAKKHFIWVTQAELLDNIRRHGGSSIDNTGKYERAWPAVIETAYAKMYDSNPADGLSQGYKLVTNGGYPAEAMLAITGHPGTELKYVFYPKLGVTGSLMLLGVNVYYALLINKSVTLWSVPEKKVGNFTLQDGLADNHVYTVLSATHAGNDWKLRVRNPWGTNMGVGEGQDTRSAVMTVSLRTLVISGGLHSFRVSK